MSEALNRIEGVLNRLSARRPAAMLLVACFALILFLPGFTSLPVTDRDEARFAQASRQMVDSGDWVDIRLGDGPRYKKPVGIYWLQAAARSLMGETFDRAIWVYRLPSLISAVAACLLTYLVALALMGARVGLAAGLLMATTIMLGAEARIAKTDAALLAAILLALWPLARLHMGGADGLRRPWLFWTALGLSMLIKGPIGVMVVALTVAGLSVLRRDIRWLAPLRPGRGVLIFALIVLPWYLAITFRAGWAFWEESLLNDFLSKLGSGQESHGAPPGTYLAAVWLSFWPAAILLPFGLAHGWRHRRDPAVLFCLAWLLPSWLVFELTATKLLHYVLPLYPALAILTAAGWLSVERPPGRGGRIGIAIILALGLVFAALTPVLSWQLGGWPGPFWVLGGIVLVAGSWLVWRACSAGLPMTAIVLSGVLSIGVALSVYSSLGRFAPLWPSPALAAMAAEVPCAEPELFAVGFAEASLLFHTSGDTAFTSAEAAAARAEAGGCAVVFVDSRHDAVFRTALGEITPGTLGQFTGFSMGPAEEVSITGYLIAPDR